MEHTPETTPVGQEFLLGLLQGMKVNVSATGTVTPPPEEEANNG